MVMSRNCERCTVPDECFVLENRLNFAKEKYVISKISGAAMFAFIHKVIKVNGLNIDGQVSTTTKKFEQLPKVKYNYM